MEHFSTLNANEKQNMTQREIMEKWSLKNASDIRQVSRTGCFTNRKRRERKISRKNIVYKIKEQEDKALMKKTNKKDINSMYFLTQII